MTAFRFALLYCLFQQIGSGFEFDNLLGGNLNGLAGARVTALSGGTLGHAHGAEANEGDFTVFFQFSLGDIHKGVDGFSCINLGHAGLFGEGIN